LVEGTHDEPGVQAAQVPALQYKFVPHGVPSGSLPAGVHTEAPVVQLTVCRAHEFFAVQSAPVEHPPQVPLLHTSPLPQTVPFGTLVVGTHSRPASPQTS
jgi:hypothetical protein